MTLFIPLGLNMDEKKIIKDPASRQAKKTAKLQESTWEVKDTIYQHLASLAQLLGWLDAELHPRGIFGSASSLSCP